MDYKARFYDAYLNHFTQPDSIIPNLANPQSLNRYSYVGNNPVNFTDPSGNKRACHNETQSGHTFESCTGSDGPVIQSGGGGGGGPSDEELRRARLARRYNFLQRRTQSGTMTDLEALAQFSDYAALLNRDCRDCYVNDMGAFLTGHGSGDPTGRELAIQFQRLLNNHGQSVNFGLVFDSYYLNNVKNNTELGQSGYSSAFQDPQTGAGFGGQQAHHFWFYVQVGYTDGAVVGLTGNALHETVLTSSTNGKSYQDYALGFEGVQLGFALQQRWIDPSQVGGYIRTALSPGSWNEYDWNHPFGP